MALYNLDLYLQEGDRGTYAVTAQTSYGQTVALTEWHPTRDVALEVFATQLRTLDDVNEKIATVERKIDTYIGNAKADKAS